MTNMTWPYIAGCIDCDGWITFYNRKKAKYIKKTYTIGIIQSSKRYDKMKIISDWLRSQNIQHSFITRTTKTNLSAISEMVNIHVKEQKSLIRLIKNILPYLLFKKEKAIELQTYLRLLKNIRLCDNEIKLRQMPKRRYWNKQECIKATSLRKQGHNNVSIANLLNRSVHSVSAKFHRAKKAKFYLSQGRLSQTYK